jgi:enolase-phosphatase E1
LLTAETQVVLLDIEGTTTPVSFVYDVLFPFARARIRESIDTRDAAALYDEFRQESASVLPDWQGASTDLTSASIYAEWLMGQDRKSTALKELQGRIWERGYSDGQLTGVVYDDVPVVMHLWRTAGIRIGIFSSGSVLAQKLIFAHTQHGDLTNLITAYFDTTTGAKQEPASYRKIAHKMGVECANVTFFSDAEAEIAAASEAGMTAVLVVR